MENGEQTIADVTDNAPNNSIDSNSIASDERKDSIESIPTFALITHPNPNDYRLLALIDPPRHGPNRMDCPVNGRGINGINNQNQTTAPFFMETSVRQARIIRNFDLPPIVPIRFAPNQDDISLPQLIISDASESEFLLQQSDKQFGSGENNISQQDQMEEPIQNQTEVIDSSTSIQSDSMEIDRALPGGEELEACEDIGGDVPENVIVGGGDTVQNGYRQFSADISSVNESDTSSASFVVEENALISIDDETDWQQTRNGHHSRVFLSFNHGKVAKISPNKCEEINIAADGPPTGTGEKANKRYQTV